MFDSSEEELPNTNVIVHDASYQVPFINQPNCENHLIELYNNDIEDIYL